MCDDKQVLAGLRILVLEDDFYLATDLQNALEAAGALIVGPFSDEASAEESLRQAQPDCALLDLNLGSGPAYDLPRLLQGKNVPFAFVTGYDPVAITAEFADVPCTQKPIAARIAVDLAQRLMGPAGGSS